MQQGASSETAGQPAGCRLTCTAFALGESNSTSAQQEFTSSCIYKAYQAAHKGEQQAHPYAQPPTTSSVMSPCKQQQDQHSISVAGTATTADQAGFCSQSAAST